MSYPQQPGYDPYGQQQPGYDPYAQQQPGYDPYAQQQAGYQQPGYPNPGYPNPNVDQYGRPLSDKSKMVAGLLGILLGSFGAGRFYTGHTGMAIGQIAATWLTCGIGGIWPLIDGIMLLAGNQTDSDGRVLRSN